MFWEGIMQKKDKWDEMEKGKEENFFLKKHREWLEKNKKRTVVETKGETVNAPACPHCGVALAKIPFQGGSVLRCTKCNGGWLDSETLRRYVGL